jgi:hypothetical protein
MRIRRVLISYYSKCIVMGPYKVIIARAIEWLVRFQERRSFLVGKKTNEEAKKAYSRCRGIGYAVQNITLSIMP